MTACCTPTQSTACCTPAEAQGTVLTEAAPKATCNCDCTCNSTEDAKASACC